MFWDSEGIGRLLDIRGSMLFLNQARLEQPIRNATRFNNFESIATFDNDFFAFSLHLSGSQSNGVGPLPGTFVVECMAQSAALGLAVTFPNVATLVTRFNVTLSQVVVPGTIVLHCRIPREWGSGERQIVVTVIAKQSGMIVSRGELTYSVNTKRQGKRI